MPRLRIEGATATIDGRPFVWRFATAFRLVDLVADDNEDGAARFLDWLQVTGFSGARVLSALCCWFDLKPADGERALPRLLDMAAARGLYLEVVALAGTRDSQISADQMAVHVAAVGAICDTHPACAGIELANENAHPSQRPELSDPTFLQRLRASIPGGVPVSMGSNCCGQPDDRAPYAGGSYLTVHTDRSDARWPRVGRLLQVRQAADASGLFAVDDEGIGAGEQDEPGRRSNDASEFFARGVLSRILGLGATFHFDDGLQASLPGAYQSEAANAFIAGTRIVGDDAQLKLSPVGGHGIVTSASGAEAVYVGVDGARAVLLALSPPAGFSPQLGAGWTVTRTMATRDGVLVIELGTRKGNP